MELLPVNAKLTSVVFAAMLRERVAPPAVADVNWFPLFPAAGTQPLFRLRSTYVVPPEQAVGVAVGVGVRVGVREGVLLRVGEGAGAVAVRVGVREGELVRVGEGATGGVALAVGVGMGATPGATRT